MHDVSRTTTYIMGSLVAALFLVGCSSSRSYKKMRADLRNEPAKQILESILKLSPNEVRTYSFAFSLGDKTTYDIITARVYNVTADSMNFTLKYTPEKIMNNYTEPPRILITKQIATDSILESINVVDLGADGKPDTVYYNFMVGTHAVNSNRWIPYIPGFSYSNDDYDKIQREGNPFIEKWYRDTILKPMLNELQKKQTHTY